VIVQDGRANVLACNPAAERILELSAAEMVGRAASDPRWDLLRSDGQQLPGAEHPTIRALRSGEPAREVVMGLRKPGGRIVWLSSSAVPLREAGEERPSAVVLIVRDISEQRQAAEQLRKSEQRLSVALRASHMGAWTWTPGQEKADWSPELAELLGADPAQLRGSLTDALSFIYAEDLPRVAAEAAGIATRKRPHDPFEFEARMVRRDGHLFWARITGKATFDAEGRLCSTTGTVADITRQHRLQEALARASKLESLGRMAGGVAHDFNNLLTVVLGSLQLAELQAPATGPLRDELTAARGGAERAVQLTQQLLALARQQPIQGRELDLSRLVADAARLLRPLLGANIELSLQLAERPWPVLADPTQLERVLLNLATNARDAMPKGGRFTVSCGNEELQHGQVADLPAGRFVRLAVADSGTGMSEEVRGHLFEPFFTTKASGNGLGLASSYSLVKQLGGAVQVESEPGRGTRFVIWLPVVV
jgi:PAS domain S-box-containing protein